MWNIRRKSRKPKAHWDDTRIKEEKALMKEYGLRTKKEIWMTQSILRKYRERARALNAMKDKDKEKVLLEKLKRFGFLGKEGTVDDVLSLIINDILNRRLETLVFRRGFAKTPLQARQMITHGHVSIASRKMIFPSYLVPVEEESTLKLLKETSNA